MRKKGKYNKKRKLNRVVKVILLAVGIILVALLIQTEILNMINNRNISKTSEVLLDRVVNVIEKNEESEKDMVEDLKSDYIIRAKAVAYILNAKPEAGERASELKKIAKLMDVDEIHLFDSTGTIYGGTIPRYYGFSFDSGEQISYFKPMLTDKKLTMCQDITPNTSEGKEMMYAMTWDETGSYMVQVGIKPVRLMKELKQNEIPALIDNMPAYEGIRIYVAEKKTGEIYGATDSSEIGKKLDDLGIIKRGDDEDTLFTEVNWIDGVKYRCTFRIVGDYAVGVVCSTEMNREMNMIALVIVGVYLLLAAVWIIYMFVKVVKSNIDELTQCLNRRVYEKDIKKMSTRSEFVYAAMDVNGMKCVNDTQGHAAGDELIQGAAECMRQCFGKYGKVYRTGGDEFVSIIFVNEDKLKEIRETFEKTVSDWKGELVNSITISSGYVYSKEKEWRSLEEISREADIRMYQAKEKYYTCSGKERRKR